MTCFSEFTKYQASVDLATLRSYKVPYRRAHFTKTKIRNPHNGNYLGPYGKGLCKVNPKPYLEALLT